jgi:hypothetical protein
MARESCTEKARPRVPKGISYESIVGKSYQRKKGDYREAEEGETLKRIGIL